MEQLTLFQGDSPASRTAPLASAGERTTLATSGRRCLEQFEKLPLAGSWAKTFAELLIGMEGWSSTKCKLTWRLRGTKFSRLYFLLQASARHTGETGFGLLPTVTAVQRDHPERVAKLKATGAKTMMSRKAGELRGNSIMDAVMFYDLLPTPQAGDEKNGSKAEDGRMARKMEQGWSPNLNDMAASRMQPTPLAGDGFKTTANQTQNSLHKEFQTGGSSQLNHLFVLEMMGFPPDWTVLPFLATDENP